MALRWLQATLILHIFSVARVRHHSLSSDCRLLTRKQQHVWVTVTGSGSLESAIAAVRFGADNDLIKSCALRQLNVILRRIVDRESLDRGNRRLLLGQAPAPPGRPSRWTSSADRLTRIASALSRLEASLGTHQLTSSHRR